MHRAIWFQTNQEWKANVFLYMRRMRDKKDQICQICPGTDIRALVTLLNSN